MASALGTAVEHLRAAVAPADAGSDGQLLGRFVRDRDEAAFAALVRRLGPGVLGVCRRACPDAHLAEDAFQAAFLVLARKAEAVHPREQVAAWLFGVAFRTASKARVMLLNRRRREVNGTPPDPPAPPVELPDDDAVRMLDAAVARLPEHLRAAVVLCELEGRSRKDVATHLGIPEGTLSSRLAKARKVLGDRLRPIATVVPAALATATANAAMGSPVSGTVLTLARGAMSMLLIRKLRAPLTAALIAVAAASGASLLLPHPSARLSAAPVPKDKEGTTPFVEWKYVEPCRELTSPVVCGAAVVVGTGDGVLRAFRAKDGEELWQYKHGQRIYHRPAADGERVYFSAGTDVTAVSASTGEQVWRFGIKPSSGPLLADAKLGLVYMGGDDGRLYALDAKTGEERWSADFVTDAPADRPRFPGKDARIDGTLARPNALSSDGELLVLSVFDQSRVVAFDAQTGKQKWSFQADGWVFGGAALTKSHVYFGSSDKTLYALDRASGELAWKYTVGKWISSTPVADGDAVYVPSDDGVLHAVAQKDGKKLWAFEVERDAAGKPTPIYSTPILRRGGLHFATGEGQFYAVNAADGKLRWKVRPAEPSELYCSPAFDGTRYFVTCRPKQDHSGEAALLAVGLK